MRAVNGKAPVTNVKDIKSIALFASAALALAAATQVTAQAPTQPAGQQAAAADQERMYGYQLMSEAERAEYRAKMRALKTQEEREAFRLEHHKKMQERAKERGVTLPDTPPAQGMGQGRREGMGPGRQSGMGQGKQTGPRAGGQPPRQGQGGNPPPRP